MLPDFLISYHFLSLPFREVRSTFLCYRTSYRIIIFRRSLRYFYCLQTPYPNYPVIPQGPKHSSLLSGFIVILSFRSVCQLCGWTVPRLVRGTCGAFRTSFVISPRYYTCYGQWSCCPVRGTIHAVGSMSVRPVRSTLHALGCLSNCPFRRILSFALSPFICPFICPFVCPFPFLSYPPARPRRKLFLGDTSCNRSSWAFTLVLSPQPY